MVSKEFTNEVIVAILSTGAHIYASACLCKMEDGETITCTHTEDSPKRIFTAHYKYASSIP